MEYTPSFIDQLQNGMWLDDQLYHHGIKGQKWGVRRPRNEDGIIQGAGARLAKKQQRLRKKAASNASTGSFSRSMAEHIQRDANRHGAEARATKNVFKKVGHRTAQLWDVNAASDWRRIARSYEKKSAKQTLKADRIKTKREYNDFIAKARKKAAKNSNYENSGQYDKELDAAIDKQIKANKAAKTRYRQTVNADKIKTARRRAGISRTIASVNRAAANRSKTSLGRTVYTMNANSYDAITRLYDKRANRLGR